MSSIQSLMFNNPKSSLDRSTRDAMLASCLRETPISWGYAAEYPLVLGPDGDQTSWCTFLDNHLVAHANLWPRILTHISGSKSFRIGFVGNVATHPDHRGHGFMTALIRHLANLAETQGLHALVLWSDLLQFYQNLGFRSIGRERRYHIQKSGSGRSTGIVKEMSHNLSDNDLHEMMTLRPKVEWSIERSLSEFRALSTIPETNLFIRRKTMRIETWIMIGKGADMQGVIHEWGARSPEGLVLDIETILHDYDVQELTVLVPEQLQGGWHSTLKRHSHHSKDYPMALAMPIGPEGADALQALSRGFIWGLESI